MVSQAKNIDFGQTEMFMYILHSRKLISCSVRNLKLSRSKKKTFLLNCVMSKVEWLLSSRLDRRVLCAHTFEINLDLGMTSLKSIQELNFSLVI